MAIAWFTLTPLATLFIGLGSLIYVQVYTVWLKPRTSWNIVLGGFAGSCCALAGWYAVTSADPLIAWVLAALVFVWTPSHFWSLAVITEEDYTAAGIPMLPSVVGEKKAAKFIVANTLLLIPISLLFFLYLTGRARSSTWSGRSSSTSSSSPPTSNCCSHRPRATPFLLSRPRAPSSRSSSSSPASAFCYSLQGPVDSSAGAVWSTSWHRLGMRAHPSFPVPYHRFRCGPPLFHLEKGNGRPLTASLRASPIPHVVPRDDLPYFGIAQKISRAEKVNPSASESLNYDIPSGRGP